MNWRVLKINNLFTYNMYTYFVLVFKSTIKVWSFKAELSIYLTPILHFDWNVSYKGVQSFIYDFKVMISNLNNERN